MTLRDESCRAGHGAWRDPADHIAAAHRGLAISAAHFGLVAGHLIATLDDLGVPRRLIHQIIAIVATLAPAVVTA